jgi:hypothetical protein
MFEIGIKRFTLLGKKTLGEEDINLLAWLFICFNDSKSSVLLCLATIGLYFKQEIVHSCSLFISMHKIYSTCSIPASIEQSKQ